MGPYLLGYDCSDCLLCGQGMPFDSTPTVILVTGMPARNPTGLSRPAIVEYQDPARKRTIWVVRQLVPLHKRTHDQPLRILHKVVRRAYSTLSPAQRAALAGD